MGWPQIVVLVFMIIGVLTSVVRDARKTDQSSGWLILNILISVGAQLGYALILHAGGFW